MTQVVCIAIGGAVGAVLRYLAAGGIQRLAARGPMPTFPWGTMMVNILGCLAMGVLVPLLLDRSVLRPEFRMAILVGMLGAFTTFSTFGYETVQLLNDGQVRHAVFYVLGTNVGCLASVWLAYRLMDRALTGFGVG